MLSNLAVVAALTSGIAACASSTDASGTGGSPTPSTRSTPAPSGPGTPRPGTSGTGARLTISYVAAPGATPVVHTLTCDPAGGTLPDAAAACALLTRLPAPFAPTPPGTMCSYIVSGEQAATVTGTLRGERVEAKFSRVDSCQTARWTKIAPLLVS